jgi:hypothetical protein
MWCGTHTPAKRPLLPELLDAHQRLDPRLLFINGENISMFVFEFFKLFDKLARIAPHRCSFLFISLGGEFFSCHRCSRPRRAADVLCARRKRALHPPQPATRADPPGASVQRSKRCRVSAASEGSGRSVPSASGAGDRGHGDHRCLPAGARDNARAWRRAACGERGGPWRSLCGLRVRKRCGDHSPCASNARACSLYNRQKTHIHCSFSLFESPSESGSVSFERCRRIKRLIAPAGDPHGVPSSENGCSCSSVSAMRVCVVVPWLYDYRGQCGDNACKQCYLAHS